MEDADNQLLNLDGIDDFDLDTPLSENVFFVDSKIQENDQKTYRFTNWIVRFPKIFATIIFIIPVVLSFLSILYPVHIDYGVDAFRIENHIVARREDALQAARTEYQTARTKIDSGTSKRSLFDEGASIWLSSSNNADSYFSRSFVMEDVEDYNAEEAHDYGKRATRTQSYNKGKLHVIFEVPKGQTVFTPERLQYIFNVQKDITSVFGFTKYCLVGNTTEGRPPESPLLAFYPNPQAPATLLSQQAVDVGVKNILRLGVYAYTSKDFSASNPKSTTLRMTFSWGLPLKGYSALADRRSEQETTLKNWVYDYLSFFSHKYHSVQQDVNIYYGGDWITTEEIRRTFWRDATFAVGSLLLISVLLWINMSSLFLAFFGILEVLIAFPCVYFIDRAILKTPYVGILNGISLFIIMGVGVDDLFVFYNFFMQGKCYKSMEKRLAFTYSKAGKATFLTSFTTAAAFASNIASQIPALRLFGIFMALLVTFNYLLVITFFPAILVIYETNWKPFIEKRTPEWFGRVRDYFVSCFTRLFGLSDRSTQPKHRSKRVVEEFFHDKFAPFIRKTRYICMAVFFALLVVSCVFTAQLRPSNTVPHFFRESNNIQKFLDWESAGAFNSEDISVPDCPNGQTRDICGKCGGDGTSCLGPTTSYTGSKPTSSPYTTSTPRTSTSSPNTRTTTSSPPLTSTTRWQPTTSTSSPKTSSSSSSHSPPTTSTTFQPFTTSSSSTSAKTTTSNPSTSSSTKTPTTSSSSQSPPTTSTSSTTSSPITSSSGSNGGCDGNGGKVDQCGVCNGQNACVGCDGVPNSGKVKDLCDVCNGNNSCIPDKAKYSKNSASVSIVWGIHDIDRSKVDPNNPFDSFKGTAIYDNSFDFSDQATQQALLDVSLKLNDAELVQKDKTKIMMQDFQVFAMQNGGFPVSPSMAVQTFYRFINGNSKYKNWVGFKYQSNGLPTRVTFIKQQYLSTTSSGLSSFDAVKDYDKWEKLVKDVSSTMPKTSRNPYQTSDMWIRVFTEVVAVNGIVKGLLISVAVAIGGLFVFTGNAIISVLATIILSGNVLFVLAFYRWMNWTLGAIEAISITILVGLCVDYLFHVADAYCKAAYHHDPTIPSSRYERVQVALAEMGQSILGGAATSVAAGAMLIFCNIDIFRKFGLIVSINLGFSTIFSLIFFCALLTICGPVGDFGDLYVGIHSILKRVAPRYFKDSNQNNAFSNTRYTKIELELEEEASSLI